MKKNTLHTFLVILLLVVGMVFLGTREVQASNLGIVNATVQLALCGDGTKDHGEQCDMSDFGGKSCMDLGYDGGSLGCTFSCDFDVSSCTTSAGITSNIILSPGADRSYIFSDGFDSFGIDLLQYFYDSDLSLYFFSHATSTTSPSGQSLVGKNFNIVFANENGDIVHYINKAGTITLSYSDFDLNTTDENTLAPYRSEDNGSTWNVVSGYTLDKALKTITFDTTSFSHFTIFGFPIVTHVSTTTNGGGGGGGGSYETPPKATPAEKKAIIKVADFNKDGHVDLADLSILLFYFGKSSDINKKYDLNHDGEIDIVDVSIMLYYWEVTS